MQSNDKVTKKSGKPFKSRLKCNTLKDKTVNPNTQRVAWTFVEDESVVDEVKLVVEK